MMSRVIVITVMTTVFVSLVIMWFYPTVQDFMAGNSGWNGIKRFSAEFNVRALESAEDLSASVKEPERTVLISIPEKDYHQDELPLFGQFVKDGGTLLLMDDYGFANTLLAHLGSNIRYSRAQLLDPVFSFKNQRMPRITDVIPELREAGIQTLVFNHATALENVEVPQAMVWSSSASFLDRDDNSRLSRGDSRGPLVAAARFMLGKGQVILVSDSSMIINSMLHKGNNYEFFRYFTSQDTQGKIVLVDGARLARSPLDTAKDALYRGRKLLSSPYALIGIVAFVFAAVYRYSFRGGKSADSKI